MKIGDKIVITNTPPYSFLCGVNKEKEPKIISIEIYRQIFNVPGEFTGKLKFTGYVAKGEDGYEYSYNYPTGNEGYGDTCWSRYIENEEFKLLSEEEKHKFVEDYLWLEIELFKCPAKPKFLNKYKFMRYCKKHQKCFYINEGCFECTYSLKEPKEKLNLIKHKWIGWYN